MEILIVILGFLIDRMTKLWALKTLITRDIVVIPNIFSFSYLENRGAAWGIFQNKLLFLSIITMTAVLGIIFYLIKYKPTSKVMRISLALIISGAIGNLFDRIWYNYVVDFILLHYKDVYYYPTFNVADMMVVIGTITLAIVILREGK